MPRKDEISAGLLAFRRRPGLEFLLAHPGGPYWARRDDDAWTIPKGQVHADDLLACAQREFTEETSFTAQAPFIRLAAVRQKSGKTVHAFAFEGDFDASTFESNSFEMEWPRKSGKRQHFPEIDRLAWFDYEAALRKIIGYQKPFIEELNGRVAGS